MDGRRFQGRGTDYPMSMYTDVNDPTNPLYQRGEGFDIYKQIGRLPKPKGGFTLPGHKYTGPYNPLHEQLEYDETGKITKYHVQPRNQVDAIASRHDVCYDDRGGGGRSKNDCDKKNIG